MDEVLRVKKSLDKITSKNDAKQALQILQSLESVPMSLEVLKKTQIGMTVNKLRRVVDDPEVNSLSKGMIKKWKKLLSTCTADSPANAPIIAAGAAGDSNSDRHSLPQSGGQVSSSLSSAQTLAAPPKAAAAATGTSSSAVGNNSSGSGGTNTNSGNTKATTGTTTNPTTTTNNSATYNNNNANTNNATTTVSKATKSPASLEFKEKFTQKEIPVTTLDGRLKARSLLANALKKPLPAELTSEPLLDDEALAAHIEEYIFKEYKCLDKKYLNRVRSRVSNLGDLKNPYLRWNVLRGDILPEKIAKMTAEEMASDELKKQREKFTKEAINDHQMSLTTGTKTSEIKCPACKKCDVTYNQVQTRSADEPMTTFCYCNLCGKRWKFC